MIRESPPLVHRVASKEHQVTEIDMIFSGPVNSLEADSLGTYRLATPGKKNSYTAKNAGIIKLKKAAYTASNHTVALTPKKPFALTKPVQVLVYGTGPTALQDSDGRDIDGDHNGTAGGNAVALLRRGGVTISAVVSIHSDKVQVINPYAVDALLARDEILDLKPFGRAAHSGHQVAAR